MKLSAFVLFCILLVGCITNSKDRSDYSRYPVAIQTNTEEVHPNDQIEFIFKNNSNHDLTITNCGFNPLVILQKEDDHQWVDFETYSCVALAIGAPITLVPNAKKSFHISIFLNGKSGTEIDGTYRMKFSLYYKNSDGDRVFLNESESISNEFRITQGS